MNAPSGDQVSGRLTFSLVVKRSGAVTLPFPRESRARDSSCQREQEHDALAVGRPNRKNVVPLKGELQRLERAARPMVISRRCPWRSAR